MESKMLKRPVTDVLSSRFQCLAVSSNVPTRRYESSYRRTKQRLNIKPDSTFLFNSKSPQQNHIIFNPPSSAPNVLITPLIFLPKGDRRKELFAGRIATEAASSTRLAPVIPKFRNIKIKHHLTDKDIAEIQRLRTTDPEHNTVSKLAKRFDCSSFFVRMCCEAPPEQKQRHEELYAGRYARMGPKRLKAREERKKRMELALRDE
ncbi:mitochondrial ribosomal protein subunit L20-domain-containing protein [Calycina marina]|uniref:Mitochondrial ribosomal protein subunit L20-domain-containing protein n=1 Tax=Calycina marina TaxID=1763456 RepID=A0A9P7Z592_9HELO|nr:mitochondrial ribosomal protein subunit L20-domain-containing protein [Calycina marina]